LKLQSLTAVLALVRSVAGESMYAQLQEKEAALRKAYEVYLDAQHKVDETKGEFGRIEAQLDAVNTMALAHLSGFHHTSVELVMQFDKGDTLALATNLEIILKTETSLAMPFDVVPVYALYKQEFKKALDAKDDAAKAVTKASEQVAVDMLEAESQTMLAVIVFKREKIPLPGLAKPQKRKRAPKSTLPPAPTPSNSDPKVGVIASGVTE
jgi:hypothetical protein